MFIYRLQCSGGMSDAPSAAAKRLHRARLTSLLSSALVLLLVILLPVSATPAADIPDHPTDRAALIDFYHATGGPNWLSRTNWLATNVSMCSWYGIDCKTYNASQPLLGFNASYRHVDLLRLSRLNNIVGYLPDSIGNLSKVTGIVLARHNLASTIPSTIGKLSMLARLTIVSCSLSGPIPNSLGNLQNLLTLDLSYNNLSSTIPRELAQLAALESMTLSANRISGTIPSEFAAGLASLLALDLNNNKLELPIPKLGTMSRLQNLLLDSNMFTGPLSEFFYSDHVAPSLVILSMSNNFFNGSLPPSLYLLNKIIQLDVSSNMLSGALGDGIANLKRLHYLKLSNNRLEGTIPDAFDAMCTTSGSDGLKNIILHSNRFEGSLPSSLRACNASLKIADFSSNRFQGSIPFAWGDLKLLDTLDLSHCGLSGTVPAAVQALPSIQLVNLRSNLLVGPLPLFSSTRMKKLDLSSNLFSGSFDLLRSNFGPAVVNVSGNMLTGSLQPQPRFIAGVGVNLLDVSFNEFVCPYPVYSPSILLQRSPCWHPWGLYMLYFGGAVASALLLTVVLRSSYMVPTIDFFKSTLATMPVFTFFASWTIVCASFGLDIKSCMDMYTHLTHPIDNCVPVNQPNMFTPFMPNDDYFSFTAALSNCKRPDGDSARLPSTYSFTEIIVYCVQRSFESRPGYSSSVIASFTNLCSSIRGCSYTDAPEYKCALTNADAAEFAGSSTYSRFTILVLIALSLRLAVDAARGIAVAVSCWRRSLAWHHMAADFIGTSPFSVFLLAALPRDDFVRDVSQREPSHRDYLLRSIHSILLSALPILLVNVYYASRVAQTGLSSVNLISTLYGAVTIPLLFVRAFLAWRRADRALTDAELSAYVQSHDGAGASTGDAIELGARSTSRESGSCSNASADVSPVQLVDDIDCTDVATMPVPMPTHR